MSDINKQLVRLGSQQPHLRPHIRAVLAAMGSKISAESNYAQKYLKLRVGERWRKSGIKQRFAMIDGIQVRVEGTPSFGVFGEPLLSWDIEVGTESTYFHSSSPTVTREDLNKINEILEDFLMRAKAAFMKSLDVLNPNVDVRWWREKLVDMLGEVEELSDTQLRAMVLSAQKQLEPHVGDMTALERAARKARNTLFDASPMDDSSSPMDEESVALAAQASITLVMAKGLMTALRGR